MAQSNLFVLQYYECESLRIQYYDNESLSIQYYESESLRIQQYESESLRIQVLHPGEPGAPQPAALESGWLWSPSPKIDVLGVWPDGEVLLDSQIFSIFVPQLNPY